MWVPAQVMLVASAKPGSDGAASEEIDNKQYCGLCFGAGKGDECCNTCDNVKQAYRLKQ